MHCPSSLSRLPPLPLPILQPSLPSCQLVQFTQRLACHSQLNLSISGKQQYWDAFTYLLTNSFPTIFALNLLLDNGIVRRPAVRARHAEKYKGDSNEADDCVEE